ncbi:legumain [Trichonephila clavipes]|nr:legumain [Trichonephila clavipes]
MTEDIANNGENLTPGIVINPPNGNDVYKGVPKDYTGEDVTPKNFMAVLKDDEKTLAGVGSGLIAFPEDELSALDLNRTINKHVRKKHESNIYEKKGHIYRDVILEQHVRLFRGAMGAEFLFMDDNARPHCANIVDECLQSEDITRMDWSVYSPDLNPI